MAMNNKNDSRSKRIVFCSSCLLNTNNKVLDLARYGGFSKDFIDILAKYDLGVQQMDCPETLYLGIQRWQHTKNLYDNVGFQHHHQFIFVPTGWDDYITALDCNGFDSDVRWYDSEFVTDKIVDFHFDAFGTVNVVFENESHSGFDF